MSGCSGTTCLVLWTCEGRLQNRDESCRCAAVCLNSTLACLKLCLMTSLSSCEENLELLTTQQVKHTFIKDGADQMTHPNDTAAAQNTLLYINFRGCNFLCKLRIPTEKENESLLSRITQKASVQTPSKELSGQLMNFCLFLPFL